jgi:hypothetical protein
VPEHNQRTTQTLDLRKKVKLTVFRQVELALASGHFLVHNLQNIAWRQSCAKQVAEQTSRADFAASLSVASEAFSNRYLFVPIKLRIKLHSIGGRVPPELSGFAGKLVPFIADTDKAKQHALRVEMWRHHRNSAPSEFLVV